MGKWTFSTPGQKDRTIEAEDVIASANGKTFTFRDADSKTVGIAAVGPGSIAHKASLIAGTIEEMSDEELQEAITQIAERENNAQGN